MGCLQAFDGVYHTSLLSSESSQRTGDHAYAGQNEHVNEGYQAEKITMRSRSLMYTVV
jgi:hypothetical protein